jgi:methionine-gamma-lyase
MKEIKKKFKGFSTSAIHAGHRQDPNYAHLTPIYASSTYVFDSAEQGMQRFSGKEEGFIYSRWGNPNMLEAEEKIVTLETFGLDINAHALLHASGMGAISTLMMSTLKAGDKVLSHYSLYGGTQNFLGSILPDLNIGNVIADLRDPQKAEDILKNDPSIKLLYLETPANPTVQIVDLEVLTAIGKKYGCKVAVDNTFATPYLQQPFKYGVDFIMHSTTKFLNGHGTAIGGVLLGRDIEFMKTKVTKVHRLIGANSNGFDSFLLTMGMKTLPVRMDRHCSNSEKIAQFLSHHKNVQGVNYNGLNNHPAYELSKKQMRHPGAMMSFELQGGLNGGIKFINQLQLCTKTVSLGTCDTLVCHPASMTHYSVPHEEKIKYGITDGLIRMSVGMEDIEDLLEDLDSALS